ncbi:hypothetical protein B0H13DRAFT_1900470 [Mycena leptocephala]|nr:hypothetical protein B0H13DRAFT_1900470 [Mycena leptocephala]
MKEKDRYRPSTTQLDCPKAHISAEKGKNSDLIPPPPSRTPAARCLSIAKYCERNRAEEAEKNRIRMQWYRAKMKANPEAYSEQQKQAKKARAKYEERCDEASYKALGKERYYAAAAKKEGARDYDMEWLVISGGSGGTSLVFGRMSVVSHGSSGSRLHYYCLPPFHDEPQGHQEVIHQTVSCYLVTSPAANEAQGVYAQWANAQRASEANPRGGAPKYACYNATISTWHACCDGGEHDHPQNPSSTAPIAPITPPAGNPTTLSRALRAPAACQAPVPGSPLRTPSRVLPPLSTPPRASHTLPICYAVGGGGAVHTSLTEALEVLEVAAATGTTRLISIQDTRYAAHVAAGHTNGQAQALADGVRLAERLRSWAVGNPFSSSAGVCCQARALCIAELRAALSAIELSAAESDGEEVEEPTQVRDVHDAYKPSIRGKVKRRG